MNTCVVVPTYQERENIEPFVRAVFAQLPSTRILVVDDSSPDGTAGSVRGMQAEFPALSLRVRPRKEGLGRAYVDAFELVLSDASVDRVIMMDADFSHDPADLPRLLARTEDLVVGSRYIHGGGAEGWERWRRALSSGGNFYSRWVTGVPLSDLTGGFNAIRAARLRTLDLHRLKSSGYSFQIELKFMLWKEGASAAEVPIIFHKRRSGESKITKHIILEGVLAPWRLRFRRT